MSFIKLLWMLFHVSSNTVYDKTFTVSIYRKSFVVEDFFHSSSSIKNQVQGMLKQACYFSLYVQVLIGCVQ